ncbi:MAG TPA: BON domain-containing protein [Myxococcota bacterium]|nr:BON domain-containing protein [Myxococcota bacterium]
MSFPFRAVALSSAVALVPVGEATAQDGELKPPILEPGPGLTPVDDGSSPEDLRIIQEIRDALSATGGLSVDARNVEIIARDGVVTLRGQVKDDAERAAVVAVARRVPGVTHVDQDLQVAPMDRDGGH